MTFDLSSIYSAFAPPIVTDIFYLCFFYTHIKQQSMVIGYDAKRAFHNYTGLGNYSRSIIRSLCDYYPHNRYYLYTPPYRPHPEHCFADRPNIRVVEPRGLSRAFASSWRSFGVASRAHRDGVELFHGLSGELPSALTRRGIRSVVTIHDLIFLRYPQFYKAIDRNIYTRKFRLACEHADLIVAISRQTRQDIVDFFGVGEDKIRLVYQSCDPQFYSSCSTAQKLSVRQKYRLPSRYLLYVGTIEHRKNLNTILRALPALPADYHLVALGKGSSYLQEVESELDRLQLRERVHLIHRSDFCDLPAIYQQAELFVLPSLFEGFGIPVLEALNSGTPVITSKTSSLPEAGGPHSLYIDPLNSEELADAFLRVIGDTALREEMVSQGYLYAREFREQRVADDLWRVYSELVP